MLLSVSELLDELCGGRAYLTVECTSIEDVLLYFIRIHFKIDDQRNVINV